MAYKKEVILAVNIPRRPGTIKRAFHSKGETYLLRCNNLFFLICLQFFSMYKNLKKQKYKCAHSKPDFSSFLMLQESKCWIGITLFSITAYSGVFNSSTKAMCMCVCKSKFTRVHCCTNNGKWVQLHIVWHLVLKGNVNSFLNIEGKTLCTESGKFLTFLAQISCCCSLVLDKLTSAPLNWKSEGLAHLYVCEWWEGYYWVMLWLQKSRTISCPKSIRKMSWG